jgi:predicted GNAT family acetyltransferase
MVHEGIFKNGNMRIQHEESDIRGRHFITDEQGNMLAELTYAVQHPDTMVVDHTEVTESLRDQNIGHELIEAVAEHARAKGRHIIPVCPFAHAVMTKKSEFIDIVREPNM